MSSLFFIFYIEIFGPLEGFPGDQGDVASTSFSQMATRLFRWFIKRPTVSSQNREGALCALSFHVVGAASGSLFGLCPGPCSARRPHS